MGFGPGGTGALWLERETREKEEKVSLLVKSLGLKPGMVVADVIVDPPDTRFLRDSKARGCTVIDGLGMLVNQGVIGVRHWTGVDPDVPVMRAALAEALGVSLA